MRVTLGHSITLGHYIATKSSGIPLGITSFLLCSKQQLCTAVPAVGNSNQKATGLNPTRNEWSPLCSWGLCPCNSVLLVTLDKSVYLFRVSQAFLNQALLLCLQRFPDPVVNECLLIRSSRAIHCCCKIYTFLKMFSEIHADFSIIPAASQERNKNFQTLHATTNSLHAYSIPRQGCSF